MINEEIRDKEVRLLDTDGTPLGIVPAKDAQKLADDRQLDLVKIAPTAKPPVCKIMDYSKYRFELDKKTREARKKQKTVEVKEIRMMPNIDTHDLNVKVKKLIEILQSGNKVKVSIRFRYMREMTRPEGAAGILANIAKTVEEIGIVEKPAKMEGRNMVMFLAPK